LDVGDELRRKLDLGATTINTHPVVDPSLVTMQSRELLAEIVANRDMQIILGQLNHTHTLYKDYRREGDARVKGGGADLYPISNWMVDCAGNGGWAEATELGVTGSKLLLGQVAPNQSVTKSFQTRVGHRVGEADLRMIATLVEHAPIDITEATENLLVRAPLSLPLSESMLKSLSKQYSAGRDDSELPSYLQLK